MSWSVGTDVGGTFTDLWVAADDGRQAVIKAPTTPDIIGGILRALSLAADEFGVDERTFCAGIVRFGHGTTAGLNALLTGNTARAVFVTTAGFGDTIEIGRMKRQLAGLTDLQLGDYTHRGRHPAVIARESVIEVAERIDSQGEVVEPLAAAEVSRVVDAVIASGARAVAIATLWSVVNPEHELALERALLERDPGLFLSVSHRIAPSVGEYGRASTTAVNAVLGPVMATYLADLDSALRARGLTVPVSVMTGDGGIAPSDVVAKQPVSVLLSGPAAGVIACAQLGNELGWPNLLTVDIGGTSFDVGTVVGGLPSLTAQYALAGADIQRPTIDIATIGAGGGSIAAVVDGSLRVGPASAGADPGPACYGRGGKLPTLTDADLVLGVLEEDGFAGGIMTLDRAAAERAITTHVAEPLGLGLAHAALGIRSVLDSRMSDLLRSVTIERGHDPREFVLLACGGQGPTHAWALARELGIETFVVPPTATTQSANGTGSSDPTRVLTHACYLRVAGDQTVTAGDPEVVAADLAATVDEALRSLGEGTRVTVSATIAIRYRGQAHHLDVEPVNGLVGPAALAATLERFERRYEELFGAGAAFRQAGFELTGLRVVATAESDDVGTVDPQDAVERIGERAVVFDDPERPETTAVYRTGFPAAGQTIPGPALVRYPGQTLVIPPGWTGRTDRLGNVVVTVDGAKGTA